jgi:hypothetical protein
MVKSVDERLAKITSGNDVGIQFFVLVRMQGMWLYNLKERAL